MAGYVAGEGPKIPHHSASERKRLVRPPVPQRLGWRSSASTRMSCSRHTECNALGWMWWNRARRKEADTAGRACPAATIVPRRLGNTATNAPRRRGTFAVIEWSSSQVERQHRAAADRPDDEPAEAHDDAALVQHGHRRHRPTPARRVLGRRTWLGNRLRQPGRGSARGAERSRRSHSGAAVRAQPPPQAPTRTDCISISTQTIKKTRCSGSSTSALAAPTSASAT